MTAVSATVERRPKARRTHSLGRAARREQRKLWSHPSRLRAFAGLAARSKIAWFLLLVSMPFVPAPASWKWRFLGDDAKATTFLSTAWQVQAAAVGFSLAVAVFALQAVVADRWRPTPREVAKATNADAVLALGVASILLTGMAVAGIGRGGASGWSGSVAVTVGAVSLGSVLPLWKASVYAVAGGRLRTIRIQEITRAVERSVDRAVHERISLHMLTAFLDGLGTKFVMVELGSRRGEPVVSGSSGYVSDVNLRRLGRVLDRHSPKVEVRGYIGLACGPDSVLARVDDERSIMRPLRKSFKLQPGRLDDVSVGFALLHHLATQALRDGDALAYEEVRSAYVTLLKIYPETWSRFGRRFDSDAAQGLHPFLLPVLAEAQQNLTRQVVAAADGPNTELAAHAAWLPGQIAMDAARLSADALFTAMLDVVVSAHYQLATRGAPGAILKQLRDVLIRSTEYGPVATVRSADDTLDRRTQAAGLTELAFKRIASVAKQLIDLDKADELGRLLTDWDEYFHFFAPEEEAQRARWQLEISQQRGPSDPHLEARVEELDALVVMHQSLVDSYDSLLLQLLGWAVHCVRNDRTAPSEAAQRILAAVPGDMGRLLEVAQLDRFESPLGHWIMFDHPDEPGGGAVDSFGPLLDAIALAVLRSADAAEPPTYEATAALGEVADGLIPHLDQMASLWAWDSVAPRGDQHERARVVSEAIRDAANRYRIQRELDVIDTPLDPQRVSTFVDRIRTTFHECRIVPHWLGASPTSVARDDAKPLVSMGDDETLPRDWFQGDARIDVSSIAEQSGRSIARSEGHAAVRVLWAISPSDHSGDALSAAKAGVQLVRSAGYEPNAVFVPRTPFNWQMFNQSLIERAVGGSAAKQAFRPIGAVDGVDVYEIEPLPPGRVIVADLRKALRWEPTLVQPEGEEFVVAVHAGPSVEEARRSAEADLAYFRQASDDDTETRALRAAGSVNLYARLCSYISVGEAASVVALQLSRPASAGSTLAPTPPLP